MEDRAHRPSLPLESTTKAEQGGENRARRMGNTRGWTPRVSGTFSTTQINSKARKEGVEL